MGALDYSDPFLKHPTPLEIKFAVKKKKCDRCKKKKSGGSNGDDANKSHVSRTVMTS